MNKSGTLWELLRFFCLLLYDQSSKLKATEAVLDVDSRRQAWHGGYSPLDGREICSNNLPEKCFSIVIVDC